MRPELDEALCRDFPSLYRDRHASPTKTSMCFGFDILDGWEPIVRRLSEYLEPLVVGTNIRASQVKEKVGSLRFSLHGRTPTKEMERAIEAAEEEAACTCPQCGARGGSRWRPNVSRVFQCTRCGHGSDASGAKARRSSASRVRARPKNYKCVVVREGDVFSVTAPGVPWVFGIGPSLASAKADFAQAMRTLLDHLDEIGEIAPSQRDVRLVMVPVSAGVDAKRGL